MNPFAEHLIVFLMFVPIITIHEAAHAWAAHLLGDDTARAEGRLTLDPIAHIDIWGTLLLPALTVLFSRTPWLIGWGRPVPVDPYNLHHPRRDEVLIALAGPAANFLLALAALAISLYALPLGSTWTPLCGLFAHVAAYLGLLNFLPLPPFDGWRILCSVTRLPANLIERGSLWWVAVYFVVFSFTPARLILDVLTEKMLGGMLFLLSGGHA